MSSARFPQLASYLGSLPAGLESYPECETKASLVLSAMDGLDLRPHADELPEALAGFVTEPPPAGVWVPTTWSDGIFHAVCDLFYPTEVAMRQWTYERSMRLANNPLYRGLMKAVGPGRMFRMGPKVNRIFQRGTTIDNDVGDKRVLSRLTFPSRLHDHINLVSNVPALRALAVLTGGKGVKTRMVEHSAVHALYECTWV